MKRRDLLKKGAVGLGVAGATTTLVACKPGVQDAGQNDALKSELESQKSESLSLRVARHRPLSKGIQEVVMVSTWPRDFPGLGTGAQRFADRVTQLSEGRLNIKYYAANELVKAFELL